MERAWLTFKSRGQWGSRLIPTRIRDTQFVFGSLMKFYVELQYTQMNTQKIGLQIEHAIYSIIFRPPKFPINISVAQSKFKKHGIHFPQAIPFF